MPPNLIFSSVTLHTGLLTAIWTIIDLLVYLALVSIHLYGGIGMLTYLRLTGCSWPLIFIVVLANLTY